MDEYADIYYVDSPRNADHRTGGGAAPMYGRPGGAVPSPAAMQVSQPVRTVYVRPAASYAQPVYGQPVVYGGYPSTAASLLGRLTTGDVIELVAQALAALQSLPAAPVATRDAGTDVGNLILFQGALAQHAKRDEQLRTLGNLVAKLVG